jgi:endonuclease/exonuclease/phosphatase (EEP) superfamily protein YafD
MQERNIIKFATANAHYGELIRSKDGLIPFRDRNVVGLQEVSRKRDDLASRLDDAGFNLIIHETDLAIAVRSEFKVGESMVFPIEQGRIIGENHVVIATEIFDKNDNRTVAATAHPDIPLRFYARFEQGRKITQIFKESFFEGNVVLGMDANHYPRPLFHDRRLIQKTGFKSVTTQEPTYILADSRHAWLGRLRFPDGKMDVVLFKGNLQELGSRVVKIRSDHGAVFADFEY